MALDIYSGKDAYVDGVGCVDSWQATPGVSAQRYSASCTYGSTNTAPGVQNWTGQMSGVGFHPAAVFPGTTPFAFQGVVNNDAGQGDLLSLDGSIMIEQLTIEINKESQAPITWQATFGFNGIPTFSSTGAADTAFPPENVYGNQLAVKTGTVIVGPATDIASVSCAVRTAQLVFRRQMSTYVKIGATYRKAGVLECDVSFGVFSPTLTNAAYATNNLYYMEIACGGDGSYWQLGAVRMLGKSGLQVDRKSNAVIGYTVNGQMNATYNGALAFLRFYDGTAEEFTDYFGEPSA